MSASTHTITSTTSRRRSGDGPRDLLNAVRIDNPKASRAEVVELFIDECRPLVEASDKADRIILVMAREWAYAELPEAKPKKPQKTAAERAERAAERAAIVAQISARDSERVEAIVTRRLLEYEMIDGRPLGDLTGAECRNLSERYGVFFHVISDTIPARAKVRNHFTELELQALARHHKLVAP